MDDGIKAVNAFPLALKSPSWIRFPIPSGMVLLKSLSPMENEIRLRKLPMDDGIVPDKVFSDTLSTVTIWNLPIAGGIVPVKSLFRKYDAVSATRFPNVGKVPLKNSSNNGVTNGEPLPGGVTVEERGNGDEEDGPAKR